MRSFKPIPKSLDAVSKKCAYSKCGRTFFTDNHKAKVCCDRHRGMLYREMNLKASQHFRKWTKAFAKNASILTELFAKGYINVSKRDLLIAGFDLDTRDVQKTTSVGRVCFQYFDFLLIASNDGNGFEINKVTNK